MSGLKGGAAQRIMAQRITVLWFPDWPVYAAALLQGWSLLEPAAVISHYRVQSCNAAARKIGVRVGMPQRHALALCPQLHLAEENAAQQAAAHEDVLSGIEQVVAGAEILRPGLIAISAAAAAKYYGEEDVATELLLNAAAGEGRECLAGTADELPTAVWAARQGKNIPAGGSGEFLANLPIQMLSIEPSLSSSAGAVDLAELVSTLQELGICTFGDFCALQPSAVASRFGRAAVEWQKIAAGQGTRPLSVQHSAAPLRIAHHSDTPINHTETAAFVARQLAARMHAALYDQGEAYTRLHVRVELLPPPGYTGPTTIERLWRCQDPLTEQDTAQRLRWQLDGWITQLRQQRRSNLNSAQGTKQPASSGSSVAPIAGESAAQTLRSVTMKSPAAEAEEITEIPEAAIEGVAGIRRIELEPDETIPAGDIAPGLWGGVDAKVRAARAVAGRAQALLGISAVRRPIYRGGRGIGDCVLTVPYGEDDPPAATMYRGVEWEGQLVSPLPAKMHCTQETSSPRNPAPSHPAAIRLRSSSREEVFVTGRGMLSATPATLQWGNSTYRIDGWAGPWPVDEDWWENGKRYARLQVLTAEPAAYLLVCRNRTWRIAATY